MTETTATRRFEDVKKEFSTCLSAAASDKTTYYSAWAENYEQVM